MTGQDPSRRSAPAMVATAVVTGSNGANRLEQVEIERPVRGELVLALEGCGLCGTDLFKIHQRRASTNQAMTDVVLGHELVGTVESVGTDCAFAIGDRLVVAHHVPCGKCDLCRHDAETSCDAYQENLLMPGGFCERVLISERAVHNSAFRLSVSVPTERAIFLEPTACVLRGIEKAGIKPLMQRAPRVAIAGCGSMGLLHLLTLRQIQPNSTVHMVDPDTQRQQQARALGADTVSDSLESEDSTALLDGALFDTVFDTVGAGSIPRAAQHRLRPGGTLVLFAHGEREQTTEVDSNEFFRAEQRIVATYSSGRMDQVRAAELINSPRFDPGVLVTHRLPLNRINDAVQLANNRQALKVLLTP